MLEADTWTETYAYDGQDRLSSYARSGSSMGWQAFQYDAVGNRLSLSADAGVRTYAYADDHRLASVLRPPAIDEDFEDGAANGWVGLGASSTSGGPHAHFDEITLQPLDVYAYDPNGNVIRKDVGASVWSYRYDYEDRLVEVRKDGVVLATHAYDALGRRVRTTEAATTTYTLYQGLTPMYDWTSTSDTVHVYGAGLRIARITASGVEYVHADSLGSTRVVTDAWAEGTFEAHYEPFGAEFGVSGQEPSGLRFTGERRDSVTGLYHLGAREYDVETGRFLQQDPILGSLSQPQTLDRYAYVTNNPTRYVDPTGLKGQCAFWEPDRFEACWDESYWTYFLGSSGETDWRLLGDAFFTAVGFIPVIGDAAATAWFVTWDVLDCMEGRCDPAMLALDLFGASPFVPNLGGITRMANRAGSALFGGLPFLAGVVRHGDEAVDLARGAGRGDGWIRNIWGKLGGPEHRSAVDRLDDLIRARKYEPIREFLFPGAGGKKIGRYADIVAWDPVGKRIVEIYQVGRTTQHGLPVAREIRALEDISAHAWARGVPVTFIPYYR